MTVLPHDAFMWMQFHKKELTNLDLTQAADRLAFDNLADEYYRQFGRDLMKDLRV